MTDQTTLQAIAALVPHGSRVLDLGCGEGQFLDYLRNAEVMLRETVRVGRVGVVAFPNFAHWPNRLSILQGRMPVTKRLPYQWYDTPNIRVGTHADLAVLAQRNGLRVLDSFGLQDGQTVRFLPNLRAGTSVYNLAR